MAVRLSEGAIASIMQGEDVGTPVLQLVTTRAIATGNGPPRYRMLMSDGVNTLSSFMLATQLNSLVDQERLKVHAICKINKFIVNILKDGRKVVIVMDLDVVKTGDVVGSKIGNPVQYSEVIESVFFPGIYGSAQTGIHEKFFQLLIRVG
uniref:60S acidic ribosomal protein P1 n=1 Tax=Sphaerodactylus townsendi TaxID=933632 RepID=A0ACB8ECQ6_9SAUR